MKHPELLWGMGAIFLAITVFAFYSGRSSNKGATQASGAPGKGQVQAKGEAAQPQGLVATYKAAFESTQAKVAEVQRALDENEKLRYENTNLRMKLETVQYEYRQMQAAEVTAKNGGKASEQTGSRIGRTLASISYKPPESMLPNQLYALGVTYFKAHEDEKAAVIFSFLTGLEDNTAFQNAHNYLMTGVAWYRLDNYEAANTYFDKALKEPDLEMNLQFQAQARLWKGLIAQHQGKDVEAQYWLRDLLDHHPHSLEASWVNSKEAEHAHKPDTAQK